MGDPAAVEQFGWLQPADMINGLALAETTPGPLILVLQFVGFLAAWNAPGAMAPMLAAVLGAVLTVWVTFLPCFAWIFLGAPHAERLRSSRLISAALTAVTAAVVGVIAHLALWFALHSLFAEHRASAIPLLRLDLPVPGSANWVAIVLAATALAAVFGLRLGFGRLRVGGWAGGRGEPEVVAERAARLHPRGGDALLEQVKLFARNGFRQREAQRAACAAGGKAHGGEHVRGLSGAGRAG